MKRLSVILILFLLYLPLSAQFKGTVYIDTDQSDIFNKGDKPLAGVMVTDGLNVAKTDKKGRIRKNTIHHYYNPCRIRNTAFLPARNRKQEKL